MAGDNPPGWRNDRTGDGDGGGQREDGQRMEGGWMEDGGEWREDGGEWSGDGWRMEESGGRMDGGEWREDGQRMEEMEGGWRRTEGGCRRMKEN